MLNDLCSYRRSCSLAPSSFALISRPFSLFRPYLISTLLLALPFPFPLPFLLTLSLVLYFLPSLGTGFVQIHFPCTLFLMTLSSFNRFVLLRRRASASASQVRESRETREVEVVLQAECTARDVCRLIASAVLSPSRSAPSVPAQIFYKASALSSHTYRLLLSQSTTQSDRPSSKKRKASKQKKVRFKVREEKHVPYV